MTTKTMNNKDTVEAPERVRLVIRDGRFANEWYYPDAAIMPFEKEFQYARVDPPAAPTFGDGHYCTHRPDDPAHTKDCYDYDKYFAVAPPAPDEADKALAQHCLAIDQLRASGCNVTLWCTPRAVVTQITFHDEDASPDIDKSFATLREAIEFAAASKQER